MHLIHKGLGHEIITGNRKRSYNLLLMALCTVWSRRPYPYNWGKYRLFVSTQKWKEGRFTNLDEEEIRSCYLEARETVYKIPPNHAILGEHEELEVAKTNAKLEVMTDQEVADAKKKFGDDVFDNKPEEETEEPGAGTLLL